MSIRIRRLEIFAITESGRVGTQLEFHDGLNVLAAGNGSGKSTCMMSILYALGLEGMLGPSQQPPFADALRRRVMVNGTEVPVVGSQVRLEIENGSGDRLTVTRQVTGDAKERQLIRCVFGGDLSDPQEGYARKDYYVRVAGAAQDERGFHRFLAEFAGLDLPDVPGNDNSFVPLYLECLFPFVFVDQLSGWRDIKARMPTYFRIPEMSQRSAEYLMDLTVLRRQIEKQRIKLLEEEIRRDWTYLIKRRKDDLARHRIMIRGVPENPTTIWPPTPMPQAMITDGDEWIQLGDAVANLTKRQNEIINQDIPQAEEVSQKVVEDLEATEEQLRRLTDRQAAATQELMGERSHLHSIQKRLQALEEDLAEYVQLRKVLDRGGEVDLAVADLQCPTCRQAIKDALLPQERATIPMSIPENIAFIRDQIKTFVAMYRDAKEVVEAKANQRDAFSVRIAECSRDIRSLKRTLHADGRAPSMAAIREQMTIEETLEDLQTANEQLDSFLNELSDLSERWVEAKSAAAKASDDGLSDLDEAKIEQLERRFRGQLEVYGFNSFPVEKIRISRESYRPSRDGYDIGLTSASDTIRVIWAFLLSMLEIGRQFQTNHPGFLVFDEPRQQGTEKLSFEALLQRASRSQDAGQQVIVATSEEQDVLEAALENIKCHYRRFDGKILQPLD